jgi:hypothetical protein
MSIIFINKKITKHLLKLALKHFEIELYHGTAIVSYGKFVDWACSGSEEVENEKYTQKSSPGPPVNKHLQYTNYSIYQANRRYFKRLFYLSSQQEVL